MAYLPYMLIKTQWKKPKAFLGWFPFGTAAIIGTVYTFKRLLNIAHFPIKPLIRNRKLNRYTAQNSK
jgi:hypothetical protein